MEDYDRHSAIQEAIVNAQLDAGSKEVVIYTCLGRPYCQFSGEVALAEMKNGCPFCEQYVVDEDGLTTVIKPTTVDIWGPS